jgi:PIN domain nuclease of toxin-antitoxin system
MNRYVTDTQAIIKFLNGEKVINEIIDSIFENAEKGENIIIVPSVVLFEIGYLYEKGRIPCSLRDMKMILDSSVNYIEEKLSMNIIETAFEITDIPELHDRLIAGTARYLKIPLITNDPVILRSKFVECVR